MCKPLPDTFPRPSPRRILVSGSSGFIGSAVVARRVRLGDTVVRLLRGKGTPHDLTWQPGSGNLDPQTVSGFDTVIHLAGEPVWGFWSASKRKRILQSRVQGTAELVKALSAAPQPPRLFLCASGINFYGNGGNAIRSEDAPKGDGFLADVCEAWEQAAKPIQATSTLTNLRIGVVLSHRGGTLPKILPAFRAGLGAIVGRGETYISWITLPDVLRVVDHLIEATHLDGPVNVVSPQPITSKEFVRSISLALGRDVHLHLPQWLFRTLLGKLADETILSSVRAIPAKLLANGFSFEDENIGVALKHVLSGDRRGPKLRGLR